MGAQCWGIASDDGMAGRFVAVAGAVLLAAGVGAFVAERAGWFGTAGWRDARPTLGSGGTNPPVEGMGELAPAPETRPPETRPPGQEVAQPDRKPALDAAAPERKPDGVAPRAELDRQPTQDGSAAELTAQPRSADPPALRTVDRTGNQAGDPPADATPDAPSSLANDSRGAARSGTGRTGQTRDPDAGMQVTVPAGDGGDAPPAEAEVAQVPQFQIPSFDIVRVERSGEAVIAGRAAPRSRVTVLQDDTPIATAEANRRGEFVAIPLRPLPPGQRQLTLRAEDPETGEAVESDRAVVIDIPRMPDDATPNTAEATRTAEPPDSRGGGEAPQVTARHAPARTAPARNAPDGPSGRSQAGAPETGGAREEELPGDRVAVRDNRPEAARALPADRDAGPSAPTGDGGARVTARQNAAPTGDGAGGTGPQATAEVPGGRGDAPIAVLVPRQGTGEVEVLQRPSGETGLEDRELVLEAVQYTVDGGIAISGRAPAEARVVAYLNDTELARTRAQAGGDWTMASSADVAPGLHTLRVELLGSDGGVQASVSTPFANQPMVDDLDRNEGMVVIQPGDNLWTIARRSYGQGWEYTLIYRANRDQIRDPDLIYPGQVFVVPEEQRRRDTGE